MKEFGRLTLLVLLVLMPSALMANTTVINFDNLADSAAVTSQFLGLTFSNTTALTAGISLNELDFPPLSGNNVVTDDSGPISIVFASPVDSVGGYFTHTTPVTLQVFNTANTQLGSTSTLYSGNLISSGNPPNEFLTLAFSGSIKTVKITGDPAGFSFTLDNLTYSTPPSASVPESSSVTLFFSGLACLILCRKLFA